MAEKKDYSIPIVIGGILLLACVAGNSNYTPTSTEKEHLALLVCAEAGEQTYEAKVAVASVVLNRVNHPDFPDSVDDVIYQSGQFGSVQDGNFIYSKDDFPAQMMEHSLQAVEEALSGKDPSNGALYYFNSLYVDMGQYPPTYVLLGNLAFFKEWQN